MKFSNIVIICLAAALAYTQFDIFDLQGHRAAMQNAANALKQEQKVSKDLGADKARLETKVAALEKDKKALLTPEHAEAFRIIASWRQICESMTYGIMLQHGDRLCVELAKPGPLGEAHYLRILSFPREVMETNSMFLQTRCKLVQPEERNKVTACKDV